MKKLISNNLFMLKYIAKFCPNHIIVSLINAILASIFSVINILFTRYIINSITSNVDFTIVIFLVLAILALNIGYSFLNIWFQQIIIPKNTQVINKRMQEEIYAKTLELDLECYEDAEFFNKFSIALQQSDSRALAVLNTFSTFIGNLFGISALVTLISSFEPILLIAICVNVILSFYINTKTIKIQHDYYEEKIPFQREAGYMQRVFYLREFAKELRLFNKFTDVLLTNFNTAIEKIIKLIKIFGKKTSKYNRLQGLTNSVFNSAIMLFLAYRVQTRILSIGDFVALSASSQQLASQLSQLFNIVPQMYEHSIYIDNFLEFLNYQPHITKNSNGLSITKESLIEFSHVTFIYPNTNKVVLNDINFVINPGEKVAFVGRNGAGKSTLIKLMTRLYDPYGGKIKLNNTEFESYNLNSLRENIGVIFQDYQLFAATIAENILMRPLNNKDDENLVYEALRYVDLDKSIQRFPDGIHTKLTKEFNISGAILSGGELQKLAIARIYAQNSNIIILDEPSSSLDPIAEDEIFKSVLEFSSNKTIILVSHRLSNVKNVDRIYFIENGRVVESGSHNELIQINGLYARMYYTQANKYLTSYDKANIV